MYGSTFDVSETAISVRPWKAPLNAITAGRPVASRAIFTAFSTASAPELKNAARAGPRNGATASRRSASSTYTSYGTIVKSVCVNRAACSWIAATTCGCGVADVEHADAAREVDERVAVDVREQRAARLGRHDRQVDGDRRGDDVLEPRHDLLRARAGDRGADVDGAGRRHGARRVPKP